MGLNPLAVDEEAGGAGDSVLFERALAHSHHRVPCLAVGEAGPALGRGNAALAHQRK